MSEKIKFSIITPSFNQGKFIQRTLDSVLSQEFENAKLEYLVIDGGSTDSTLEILKNTFLESNKTNRSDIEFKYISEKDKGQAHAVNKGITQSSGDIIGWLNSDDIYYPNTLQKVKSIFDTYPEIDIIYGNANHIDENDQIISSYPTEPWSKERLLKICYISQPTVFFRRSLFLKLGLLNENLHFCMDYEFWLRCANASKQIIIYYENSLLAATRLYPQTKTMSQPLNAINETLLMLKNQLGYVPLEWVLRYTILFAKNKNQMRKPHLRYIFYVWWMTNINVFKWNGFWRILVDCMLVPFKMLSLFFAKEQKI